MCNKFVPGQIHTLLDSTCNGKYSNSFDFLFAVSHFSDNVTQTLGNDDGEETEDYDTDDFLHKPSTSYISICDINAQPASNTDNICDGCWSTERANVVLVPCGHSRFCQTCADR